MFRPQKPNPHQNQQPARHRLPIVERGPKQEDIATLFTGALRIRGTAFELPIKPNPYSKVYLVSCQFDHIVNETVWSMYEGEDGSKQLWSCPQSDLDMVFDMVCMGCQVQGASTPLPAELMGSQTNQPSDQSLTQPGIASNSVGNSQAPSPSQPYVQGQGYNTQPIQPGPASPPFQPMPGYYPQNQVPYPNQQPQQSQPYPAQQGYMAGNPNVPYQNYPPAQNPYSAPGSNVQASPWNSGVAPNINPGPEIIQPDPSIYMDLLNKGQANVLLGQLFLGSGLITEKLLDLALKLQEMVRKASLTDEQAMIALKKLYESGGEIDDALLAWAKNPEHTTKSALNNQSRTSERAKNSLENQKILELLQQSGLVGDAELELARKVKQKHGGEIGQILVSANKIGVKTLEAAALCQQYVQLGKLRIDKAMMALHYCERMRTGLKEALSELNIELE